ncbi:hypothetical protein F2Y39_16560 [Bacteroides caccae]|uniref:Uncharacterized protein n=1 Tax=Bacteroides caccae TaxID=47678 RepID=A0A6H9QAB8_9BACE|nr:hypothetical protein F2Y39_16560 [Bacteroides caccae]KAA5487201.1 hypothetical protein F2Y33_07370 [Bacteroides caccae]RYU02030.1 hypothetical protein EAJ00_15625 [Bacteroides caccae]
MTLRQKSCPDYPDLDKQDYLVLNSVSNLPACESRGFVHKKKEVCILTHLLIFVLLSHITKRKWV